MQSLAWGILGTGRIARTFAQGVQNSQTGKLVAVGSRTQESADKFGEEFNIERRHPNYEALLADDAVQAVYISTPHPWHAQWAIRAAEAGKHILCEKPIGMNLTEVMAIIEAARRHDVFFMEAFMYRCHPQTQKLVELVREGAIGEVRLIRASFGYGAGFDQDSRTFNHELGGGGILDVGCYPVSMSRLIAGAANNQPFAEPTQVHAVGHLGESGVDEYTVADLKFPGEIVAQLGTAVALAMDSTVQIFGTKGQISVPAPWVPARDGGTTKIILTLTGQDAQEIEIEAPPLYSIEADTVAQYLEARESPTMSHEDSLGNAQVLDQWRAAIGLKYPADDAAGKNTVAARPLQRRESNTMKYGRVEGVEKPISRLVMGCDNQPNLAYASVMFDDYFERGGNCFDTAFIYGGGTMEKMLGQWIQNRGVRDDVAIIAKGAHTPFCDPENLSKQLLQSLERLQTDYADLYFMHRDNPQIPVGEFVVVLNEHQRAGRIRAFGGSNWSLSRVQEANEYARSKNLTGFAAVSNNFSLARMVEPVWAGCIAASDAESRARLQEWQMPLFAWSSQARGFFVRPNAGSDDAELVRCWHSEGNFECLKRVQQMAAERNLAPINLALAYVLAQPFPTFPLIGPRTLEETRTTWPALEIELSPDDLQWLNLEK